MNDHKAYTASLTLCILAFLASVTFLSSKGCVSARECHELCGDRAERFVPMNGTCVCADPNPKSSP